MRELYLGMISGTSVDGVDCAIVEFGSHTCTVIAARTFPYTAQLHNRIEALIREPQAPLRELGATDISCGKFFAESALALISESGLQPRDITAIGHHGQTVYHEPNGSERFTLQIGDASTVAAITGIATVADIRSLDMALGGQGAPMVPAFHAWLFADAHEERLIANIGGIANLTLLMTGEPVTGFDTGPGNTLMDLWIRRWQDKPFDRNGHWAAAGKPVADLLGSLLADPYFALAPPKSTGRERFNSKWLETHLARLKSAPEPVDVQATLAELTAITLTIAVTESKHRSARLIVCGGGAHNSFLLSRLATHHHGPVTTTADIGLHPDWVEAVAFAWLARARIKHEPGNVPTVTGARKAAVLGGLYSHDTN